MTQGRSYSVFEYGYLVSEKDKTQLSGAEPIPESAFTWLEQRCLKDRESDDQRLLSLRTLGGVKVIQVKNYVGVIALPQHKFIEVLPKTGKHQDDKNLARRQLLMMLKTLKAFRHVESASASVQTSKMFLLDVFIQQFIASMDIIVQKGLKHDYLRQQENQPWLKGKLHVSEQLKKNSVRRDRFFVEYDEYRVERPENRLLKTAIEKVYGYTSNPGILQALSRLQALFESIPEVHDVEITFKQVRLDRHMQHYKNALEWAALILRGESPHCMQGNADAISLLFPMEAVFESFVTTWLRQHCQPFWQVKAQSRSHYLLRHGATSLFQLRPDIWLVPQGDAARSPIICDMKWKLIETKKAQFNLSQSDLYQMLAYGVNHLQGEGDMLLIYPQHEGFSAPSETPFEYHHCGGKMLRLWVIPFETGTTLLNSRLLMPATFSLTESRSSALLS